MWLIDTTLLTLIGIQGDPEEAYAILSHTWGEDDVTFASFQEYGGATEKAHPTVHDTGARQKVLASSGYAKIKNAAKLARRLGLRLLWVDTYCIDKTSSAELSESINSMYRWYRDAKFCIAYLSDVEPAPLSEPSAHNSNFRGSRWFTRGWTLQELVAPKTVMFYAKDWSYLMVKEPVLSSLEACALLAEITGISQHVLLGTTSQSDISVANRMRWAACRKTTRSEDMAYCLLGLFDVNMPLLYGEGDRAFVRLQDEILKETDDQSLFLWALSPEESTNSDDLCGLLAPSPRLFSNVDFDYVRPLPPSRSQESAPVSMTNQGLRTSLMLVSCDHHDDEYYALLDCVVVRPQDSIKDWSPCIILRRLWGDQFARIPSPSQAFKPLPYENLGSKNGSVRLLPVVDPQFFDEDAEGSYRNVYVRQNPFDSLPEVTIRSNYLRSRSDSLRLTYTVIDAYPPDRWDATLSVLRIKNPKSGGTIVALRFAPEKPTVQSFVDMTVGLRRVGGRWEVCYEKHPFAGVGSQIENLYRMFPHISVASEDTYQGRIQMLSAVVITATETQRRGRRFIQLDVFGISEHHADSSREQTLQPTKTTKETPASYEELKETLKRFAEKISVTSRQCCCVDSFGLSIYAALPSSPGVRTRYPGDLSDLMDKQFASVSIPEDKPYYELMKAIKDGNFPGIHISTVKNKSLIDSTIEELHGYVGAYTKSGLIPIHLAVLRGRFDIACELATAKLSDEPASIKAPVWMNFLTAQEETVLHLLAAYGRPGWAYDPNFEKLSGTLELHTAQSHINSYGELALHRAAATGNMEEWFDEMVSKRLEGSYPLSREAADFFGRTLIFHAACGGNVSVIRKLARIGALTHSADRNGIRPIHAAVMAGQASAVGALLDMGALRDMSTSNDCLTPLHLACLYGFESCVEELLRPHRKDDSHEVLVDRLSADGACWGFQAIHVAAGNGHTGCVAKLLQSGCQLNRFVEGYMRLKDSKSGDPKGGSLVVFEAPLKALEIAVVLGKNEISSQIYAKMESSSTTSLQERFEALLSPK